VAWRRDVPAVGDVRRQRLLDRTDGMREGIGIVLAEGGHRRRLGQVASTVPLSSASSLTG
jgi:hypothetical protein